PFARSSPRNRSNGKGLLRFYQSFALECGAPAASRDRQKETPQPEIGAVEERVTRGSGSWLTTAAPGNPRTVCIIWQTIFASGLQHLVQGTERGGSNMPDSGWTTSRRRNPGR